MATIDIYNQKGERIDGVEFDDRVFSIEPNIHVMHEVCRAHMAAQRQGTHQTKTRGQVSGGGSKPWRQKGTGRARQGSTRAPHWRGGGVVWGPHPRDYSFKVPKKVVNLAMRSALSAKLADDELLVVDSFDFEAPKTKDAIAVCKALGIDDKRITLVIGEEDANTWLSFRNIPGVRIITERESNCYDFIDNGKLVFTLASIKYIEGVLA
ncbi:MAG: 50S ribosomal protein L4 [Coriobacteriales bacterium]|jgi:large subunit ribosomal protein L4